MAIAQFHEFDTRDALTDALTQFVKGALSTNMMEGDFASIALSGGSTPKAFLERLGKELGDAKDMVYFALVDERFVPDDNGRSNAQMIRTCLGLLDHPASEFLTLYDANSSVEEAANMAESRLREDDELPFDVVTLGMGLDGHTASFFPGADNLSAACDPSGEKLFLPISAPGAGEPRITMTLPAIVSAKNLILHIEGAEKRAVFEKTLEDGPADDMPVRHIIRHPDVQLQVYWTP